jgi:hypothetical protein
MPKIRTQEVFYTISPNKHKIEVNIMYDTNSKVFYVVPPKSFEDSINTMPDDLKEKYLISSAMDIRGVYGWAIVHESEGVLLNNLPLLFNYCGNAIKAVRNVIIVWCKGNSSEKTDKYERNQGNHESKELKQNFKFILAVETKVGEGTPVYTWQDVTWTNTINLNYYDQNPIVIDDTPENRMFLHDIYSKFDSLIVNLAKFFATSDTVLQLIASNQKLIG